MTSAEPETWTTPQRRRRRTLLFGAVVLAATGIAAAALYTGQRDYDAAIATADSIAQAAPTDDVISQDGPALLFVNSALGADHDRVASAPAGEPSGPRAISELRCERVDYRGDRGICLRTDRGFVTTYEAVIFDSDLAPVHTVGLAGLPSRTRLSPEATRAGVTVFVSGHSYAGTSFSTQTVLIDMASGAVVADLETDFDVIRDGEVWSEVDFNFWGITFVDETTFYATLGTGGSRFLVRGDITTRRFSIEEDGVECPSLSPDGTRIAFKWRRDDSSGWGIAVLDIATGAVNRLPETRNVDDQVYWIDDSRISYALPRKDSPAQSDTWMVAADGTTEPSILVPLASSTVKVF